MGHKNAVDLANIAIKAVQYTPAILETFAEPSDNSGTAKKFTAFLDAYTHGNEGSSLNIGFNGASTKQINLFRDVLFSLPGLPNQGSISDVFAFPVLIPAVKIGGVLVVAGLASLGVCALGGCVGLPNPPPPLDDTDSSDSTSGGVEDTIDDEGIEMGTGTTGDIDDTGSTGGWDTTDTTDTTDGTTTGDTGRMAEFLDVVEACNPIVGGVIVDLDPSGLGLCVMPNNDSMLTSSIIFSFDAQRGVDNANVHTSEWLMSDLGPWGDEPGQATATVNDPSGVQGVLTVDDTGLSEISLLSNYDVIHFHGRPTVDGGLVGHLDPNDPVTSYATGSGLPNEIGVLTQNRGDGLEFPEGDRAPGTLIYGGESAGGVVYSGSLAYNPTGIAFVGDTLISSALFVVNSGVPGSINGNESVLAYLGTVEEIGYGGGVIPEYPNEVINLGPAGMGGLREVVVTRNELGEPHRFILPDSEGNIFIHDYLSSENSTVVLEAGTITSIEAQGNKAYVSVGSVVYFLNLDTETIEESIDAQTSFPIRSSYLSEDGLSLFLGAGNELYLLDLR